jgi:hypothetical protein
MLSNNSRNIKSNAISAESLARNNSRCYNAAIWQKHQLEQLQFQQKL